MSKISSRTPCALVQDPTLECPGFDSLCWMYVEAEGVIASHNAAARHFLGYSEGEFSAMNFRQLFVEEELKKELPEAQSVLVANQKEYRACAHLKRKDGRVVPVALLYRRANGEPKQPREKSAFSCPMHVVVFEMPQHAELERLLGGCQSQLESFAQERHRMIRSINHQMRSPLTVMALSVNLLRDYFERMSPAERMEEIKQIEEGIAACQKVLERSVAASRATLSTPPPPSVALTQ